MFDKLKAVLFNITAIPQSEWDVARDLMQIRNLKKGEYLVQEGQVSTEIYFVNTGLVRMYYTTQDGGESVRAFVYDEGFLASYSSLLLKQKSWMNIQAIEPTSVVVIRHDEFVKLFERHTCWQVFGRKMAEALFILKERREFEFLTMSATERYEAFCKSYPKLVDRVPKNQIASYLGITPVAFSRILASRR